MRFLLALLCCCQTALAATFYVAPDGSDAAAGTIDAPWRTLYYATGSEGGGGTHFPFYLAAGDTLYMRGGVYSGPTNRVDLGDGIGNSGTSGSPITLCNYPGEYPVICDITNNSTFGLRLLNKSYWNIHGILWSNVYAGVAFSACTNFSLSNCVFTKQWPIVTDREMTYSAACLQWAGASQSNRIQSCVVSNWGTGLPSGVEGDWMTEGTPIQIGPGNGGPASPPYTDYSYYNLVENCTFNTCGHDLCGISCGFNVIRSNLFYNPPFIPTNAITGWYHRYTAPPVTNQLGLWGARIMKQGGGDNDFTDLGYHYNIPDCRTVVEDNTYLYASYPTDSNDAVGLGIGSRMGIYRRNRVAFCMGQGMFIQHSGNDTRDTAADTNNPAYYHSGMKVDPWAMATQSAMVMYNCIYGNVLYGNGAAYEIGINTNVIQQLGYGGFAVDMQMDTTDGTTPKPATNQWNINNFLVNNIFWANARGNISNTMVYTANDVRTNWDSDFGVGYPLFTSTNGFGYTYNPASVPDFHIATNSPCVDQGAWLTTAMGAGTSTTLTVTNSLWFSDGNRCVTGDTIQLQGDTNTAVVVYNDWTNNVLTLSAPLTWTNGQGVSLAYNGVAPDMGAYETAGTNAPVVAASGGGSAPPNYRLLMQ